MSESDEAKKKLLEGSPSLNASKEAAPEKESSSRSRALLISFLAMVVVGLGNKIFQKLQTIPMHNYPFFLNLLTTFIYVPVSFMYIIPMIKYGTLITPEQRAIPKWKFAVMGTLDSIAGLMQTLAATYIVNGSLLILLQQAAIPISMVISKYYLKARYNWQQYFGAVLVMAGLGVVLGFPGETPHHASHGGHHPHANVTDHLFEADAFMAVEDAAKPTAEKNQLVWALVMIVSCIPMCLSSVYKEKALGEVEIDVVFLNGWVAVFQFLVSLPLALPSALATKLPLNEILPNIHRGLKCYGGINSYTDHAYDVAHGIQDDHCGTAPLFVTLYLCFNLTYNVLIILILKYGSSNILWMAMTVMVPMGNVAFALKFVPGHHPLTVADLIGLALILGGLIIYRFLAKAMKSWRRKRGYDDDDDEGKEEGASDEAAAHAGKLMGLNAMAAEMLEPVFDTLVEMNILRSRSTHDIRASYFTRLGIVGPLSPKMSSPPRAHDIL